MPALGLVMTRAYSVYLRVEPVFCLVIFNQMSPEKTGQLIEREKGSSFKDTCDGWWIHRQVLGPLGEEGLVRAAVRSVSLVSATPPPSLTETADVPE